MEMSVLLIKQVLLQFIKDPKKYLGSLFISVLLTSLITSWIVYQQPKSINTPVELNLSDSENNPALPKISSFKSKSITVKSGDTWSTMFHSLHLDYQLLKHILTLPEVKQYLTPLRIKQRFEFKFYHGALKSIKTQIDSEHMLIICYQDGKLSVTIDDLPVRTDFAYTQGIIQGGSFLSAAYQSGLTQSQALTIANIFQSKINFSTSLHKGDKFEVLYQKKTLHGNPLKEKPISVIKLHTHRKTYTAIQFTNKDGKTNYYDEHGEGIQPALKRIPLKYRRISSHFSNHRFHPILHIYRPHLGVDFAAKVGTPIRSVGDGKIISINYTPSAGRIIKIRYNRHYVSIYAHLSRLAKNLHPYDMVSKEQVIGYVGSTGLATGPHLHYGVYVDGHPKNPLKVKLPGIDPVSSKEKQSFLNYSKSMLALLELYQSKDSKITENDT
jgi:murein DD-endopeptidase MepM/ murein hydrolase activator NlpD